MTIPVLSIHLLVLAVIFVNGWTDAPNAIATAVGSGSLTFRQGVRIAAMCNLVGAALSCLLFPAVATTIGELIVFSHPQAALTVLCATMLSIVIWAVAAWRFGLPTSESHALIAGLSGGALAMGNSLTNVNAGSWLRTLAGLALSLPAGTLAARFFRQWLTGHIHDPKRWQRVAAALMALLHGAQDGQKFMALLLMANGLSGRESASNLFLVLLTAGIMALGTALGGKPIVEKVGTGLAALTPTDGLAADLGAGAVLLVCSLLGLPISTTHAKVAAVCGAGRRADPKIMGQMAGAWALTFPCCGLLSFLLTKLMLP